MGQERKKVIIIGASGGIGRALAGKLSAEGWVVGLTGRSLERLQGLRKELPGETYVCAIDIRDTREAIHQLNNLIMIMRGVDLVIINAGVLFHNLECRWDREEETVKVNVLGFAAMANTAVNYFLQKQSGCVVGISSVAGHRGSGRSPAYNASKAFMINYMEGLRQRLAGTPIRVIDIRPGFINTDMLCDRKSLFGVASTDKAARDIYRAIQKQKRIAYVPAWWGIVMWFFKRLPENLYHWGYRKYAARDNRPRNDKGMA